MTFVLFLLGVMNIMHTRDIYRSYIIINVDGTELESESKLELKFKQQCTSKLVPKSQLESKHESN